MSKSFVIVFAAAMAVCAIACVAFSASAALPATLPPDNAKPSPTGTVNLFSHPEDRWRPIVQQVVKAHGFEHSFKSILDLINHALPKLKPLIAMLEKISRARFPVYAS